MRCFARASTQLDRDKRSLVFLDGENLAFRFQDMVAQGFEPLNGTTHIRDTFVWHPDFLKLFHTPDIIRMTAYTSAVGDTGKIDRIRGEIKSIKIPIVTRSNVMIDTSCVVPCVFKKSRQSQKSPSVDIAMTIEIMRHTLQGNMVLPGFPWVLIESKTGT